eukprot:CAMPEP_0185287774 /NCGR_PEP_ID=MMETSP1363-20130426/3003_1 /TAXON_ID=38817 /ORGANISM="Gephyrocapsa oceanica, Strain RCC1303" /LENGTH=593 /DNA_ID=CAMNT_0027883627 /DNA_START=1 /DNA_END=1782 /DNA_ORIENTATION=+
MLWRGGGGGGGGPRSRSPPDDRLSKRQRRARSRSRSPGGDGEGGALRHFQEHSAKPGFKKLHHPERVAEELLAFREAARRSLRQLVADLKQGSLLGPRLAAAPSSALGANGEKRRSEAENGEAEESGGDGEALPDAAPPAAEDGGAPLQLRPTAPAVGSVVVDGLTPGSLTSMLPALYSALAGGEGAAAEASGLTAIAAAEPIGADRDGSGEGAGSLKLRLWAGYASGGAARAAARAAQELPQLAELAPRAALVKAVERVPPLLRTALPPQRSAAALLPPLRELCAALADRAALPTAEEAAEEAIGREAVEALPCESRLHLLLLYLRRVLAFDAQMAVQHGSPAELISSSGEWAAAAFPRPERSTPDVAKAALERCAAHQAYLQALGQQDKETAAAAVAAGEAFYAANCLQIEEGKYRCPLSGKVFRGPAFVRKHIDNKHASKLDAEVAAAFEPKFKAYFLAADARVSALRALEPLREPPSPPSPRAPRFDERCGGGGRLLDERRSGGDDRRGGGGGKGGGGGGGGGGRDRDCFNCGQSGHLARDCPNPRPGVGRGVGGSAAPRPPPAGALVSSRPIKSYMDLDAPEEDDLFT